MSEELDGIPDSAEFFRELEGIQIVDDLSLKVILEATEARINEEGWDQRPVLAFVRGNDMGAETAQLVLPDEVAANFPHHFPRFANDLVTYVGTHRDGGPYAEWIKALQEEFLGPSFQGVVLSVERWSVREPNREADPSAWAKWKDDYANGRLHEREDRVENRITALLTPDSDFHQVARNRGGEPKYLFTSGEGWEFGQFGMIPEALRTLMRALVALQFLSGLVNEETSAYWTAEYHKAKEGGYLLEEPGRGRNESRLHRRRVHHCSHLGNGDRGHRRIRRQLGQRGPEERLLSSAPHHLQTVHLGA